MTVLLTLSNTPVWQSVVANSNFRKIKRVSDSEFSGQNICFEDTVSLDNLKQIVGLTSDIMLCYESPEESLAHAFSRNESISETIDDHVLFYSELLNIHRKSRRKLSLINLNQLAVNGIDSELQREKLGFTNEVTVTGRADITAVDILIAQKAIEQHEELDGLYQSLQASSISGATNKIHFDISQLVKQEYTQNEYKESLEKSNQVLQLEYRSCKQNLDELIKEQELQQSYVLDLQSTLDADRQLLKELNEQLVAVHNEAKKSAVQNADLLAERQILQNNLSTFQIELASKQQGLLEQDERLVSMQQQLELLDSANAELRAERELLTKTVLLLQDELQLEQSIAIELEQVLRNEKVNESKVRLAFEQRLSESYAEKELVVARFNILADESVKLESAIEDIKHLSLQLEKTYSAKKFNEEKVQELSVVVEKSRTELSELYNERNKFNDERNKLNDELNRVHSEKAQIKTKGLSDTKRLKREVNQLENKYEKIIRELLSTTDKLQYAEYQLNKIKSSATWKLGAPARAVSKKLRKEDKDNEILKQNVGLLYTSELFDVDWYLGSYPDIKEAGLDPAQHYLLHGAKEGRLPSAAFDGNWYLRQNPDVAESGMNPLVHYIKYGMAEGRMVSPKLLSKG